MQSARHGRCTCHLISQKAEAGGLLQISGNPQLLSEFNQSQPGLNSGTLGENKQLNKTESKINMQPNPTVEHRHIQQTSKVRVFQVVR